MDWFLHDRDLHHERVKAGVTLNQDTETHETEYFFAVKTTQGQQKYTL